MKKLVIYVIGLYQKFVSPLKRPTCRFSPTCSFYTIEAVERYGALKGLYLGLKRISRCHPFSSGGYDPLK